MTEEKALAKREVTPQKFTTQEMDLIRQTVAKDATPDELRLFLYTAVHRGLNPLTRQIHLVKRGGQGVIQTGIDGFRLIAQRTGQYAPGSKPTVFEYDDDGKLERATIYGIKIVNGQSFEFSATAKFSEYAQYFSGKLGSMWEKMPETMLEKCAEAKMLRRGFPEELSGLYTDDEMQQADTQHVTTVTTEVTDVEAAGGANLLETCPEHGDIWRINKFGKRAHIMPDKTWCNFRKQVDAIASDLAKRIFKEGATLKEWVAKEYDGRTWAKLSEEEMVEALDKLQGLVDDIESSPLAKEAVELGAEVIDILGENVPY